MKGLFTVFRRPEMHWGSLTSEAWGHTGPAFMSSGAGEGREGGSGEKSGGEGGLGTQASWGAQHGWLAAVWMVNCSIWLSNTLSLASTLQALNLRIWTSNSNTLLLHIQLVGNVADLRNIWWFQWELKWKSMNKRSPKLNNAATC